MDEERSVNTGSGFSLMDALAKATSVEQLNAPSGEWRRFYDEITRRLEARGVSDVSFFLNYGYVDSSVGPKASEVTSHKTFNSSSVRLVLEVIGTQDLNRQTIVDVGCGRGGASAFIADLFTAKIIGIDLSPNAIAFCRKTHLNSRLHFKVGDAMRMPLDDACCDVVINIESSHAYTDIGLFLREVQRILRPGGWFLYADLLSAGQWNAVKDQLRSLTFIVSTERDITANVLAARDEVRGNWFRVYGEASASFANFMAVPGSAIYEQMSKRVLQYKIVRAQLCG